MLDRGVARHEVHEQAESAVVAGADERVEVGERPERGGDIGVVGDVVAEVGERARVDRAEPDRVDAQGRIGPGHMVEVAEDAGEVPDAVAVRVGEGARIDLIEDGALPPSVAHGSDSRLAGAVAA